MRKPRPQEQYPFLLVHRGKHGDRYIVANNNEEEALAWLAMFYAIDTWDGYYMDGHGMADDELEWYHGAQAGDAQCAQWLLDYRSDHEYEDVFGECVSTSPEMIAKFCFKCTKCEKWLPKDTMRSVPGCVVTSELPCHICPDCDPLK